jgi:hypothetical protein
MTSMSLRRFQSTIEELGLLVIYSAVLLIWLAFDGLGAKGALAAESACGLIWGATVGAALHFNFELQKRHIGLPCPADGACGPPVWRRLEDSPDAASGLPSVGQ